MTYRKFKADQLFDGYRLLDARHVLITDEQGMIDDIVDIDSAGEDVQKFSGILSPGFINCHCHLELSHLKNVIPPHSGLIEFLCTVVTKRNFDPLIVHEQIVKAEKEMFNNGIVAVGDISNTADTAEVKSKSKIYWQNFIEVLGFTDQKAEQNINHYKQIAEVLESKLKPSQSGSGSTASKHRTSLVPHAPYSISPKTFQLINELTKDQIISIHNQEHPAEDELYKTGGGEFLRLFNIFGINSSPYPTTAKSSIQSCLPYFNNGQTILLIHNTYMAEQDIVWANDYALENRLKLVYCFCPNANLYIENKVPAIEIFIKHNCHIVLGTDSYSSNWQLSIAKEIQSVHSQFSKIALETMLQWATIKGARALQWDDELGSFKKGKKPGVVLIENDFFSSQRLI